MRRVLFLPALMIALLLSGCASEGQWEKKIDEKRTELCSAVQISFDAAITADLGENEFLCKLKCTSSAEETVIEVVEPEMIAGIKARIAQGETKFEYDGVVLSVGALTDEGLTPVASIPVIITALKGGHMTQIWHEKDGEQELVVIKVYVSDSVYARLWLSETTLEPVHAELVSDDKVIIGCSISGFTIT